MIDKQKVLIVGGEHHNGLNLARNIGDYYFEIHCLLITEKKYSYIERCKYIKSTQYYKNEKQAFKSILDRREELLGAIILPYSDGAASELDRRLNEFLDDFIVPSIRKKEGRIVDYMNKEAQYNLAQSLKLKVADTYVLDLYDTVKFTKECILKPISSVEGKKADITVCKNAQDLETTCKKLRESGYFNVLCQEYLKYDYEILIFGSLFSEVDKYVFAATKVLRTWPAVGGSGTLNESITEKSILKQCDRLVSQISKLGYCGLIDIECFWINGELYLNEINWRNSGGGYKADSSGFEYAKWWCCDVTQKKYDYIGWIPRTNEISITGYRDIRNVRDKNISLLCWIRDFLRAQNHSLIHKHDMAPFWAELKTHGFINKMINRTSKK